MQVWSFILRNSWLTAKVNLLPMANHIISLGRDGCVAEQGSFADLQASDGYVKSLCLASRRIDDAESVSAGTPGLIEFEIPARNAVANVPAASSPTRQTGDVTIYTYYFATIGPRLTIVFLGLAAFWGFINAFPSMSIPKMKCLVSDSLSDMVEVVGRCQRSRIK